MSCEFCRNETLANSDAHLMALAEYYRKTKGYPDQTIKADAGKPQLSLVPPQIMHDIAVIREFGNRKYSDPDSWRRVDPQRYIDALLRHALAFGANPLGTDEESGLPHLWHLECNAAFLSEMYRDEFRRLLDGEWRKEN